MRDKLFDKNATETITITHPSGEVQTISDVEVSPSKGLITIKDFCLPNEDIYTLKVEVGDTIEHKSKAGTTETYIVKNAEYRELRSEFPFPNRIEIQVENIKLDDKEKSANTYNISGITGSNISISSPYSRQNVEISKEIMDDPELKAKLQELEDAIKSKDKNKLQYIIGYLLDKGFDLGVGILLAKLTGQI